MTTPVELQTVPVHVVNAHEMRRQAPPEKHADVEVNCNTYFLGTNGPELLHRILDRDPARMQAIVQVVSGKAYLCHSSAQAEAAAKDVTAVPASSASASAEGSATNPGAFGTIAATSSVPAGTYQVTATVYLSGTVTVADANNMELFGTGISTYKIAYPGVANTPVTFTATVTTTGLGGIGVQSIGAASGAAAVYNASVTVTPVPSAATVTPATTPQDGFILAAGVAMPPLKTTDPMWVACPSDQAAAGILVSVITERRRA